MNRGRICGSVWASKGLQELTQQSLKLVCFADGTVHVALDPVGCREGDTVLVAYGSAARRAAQPDKPSTYPADAAVVAILDEELAP